MQGGIPPYHMAHCRMFMRFDGHKIKNGLKITGSSHRHLYKHIFNPEKINFPKGFDHELKKLDLNSFRAAMQHNVNIGFLPKEYNAETMVQQVYLET